ncbi:MAG: urease accessory protein UreE [Gammaproteobacteria bacterium]
MLRLTEKLDEPVEAGATLTLPFGDRQKSRLRTRLDDGREAGLMLERGLVLRHGDCLRADDGTVVRVQAAPEAVSTAFSRDPLVVARACYHLGNRHVPLQIGDTWVRYLHDHVLDAMVEHLGLRVFAEHAPFEPEAGAYDGHSEGAPAHDHHEHHHGHGHPHHEQHNSA